MSRRVFLATALVVALLVAGVGSYYASSHPDGLERVAGQTGFADSAEESATADSPLAGYGTRGVDSPRLGTGVAGVVGALTTLLLTVALTYAVRRRRRADAPAEPADPAAPEPADLDPARR